jgi:hypothetical protein
VKFRIGALALDRTGVEHLIASLEQRHVGADGIDDSRGVVAQNLGLALRRRGALAHLVVDGISRDRLHGDADVAALRFRLCRFEIDQRIRGIDGKGLPVSDSFHARCLRCECRA